MIKSFIQRFGLMNVLLLLVVFSIIVVSEFRFMQGEKLEAIFIGIWAPTILGFMNLLKFRK